MNGDGWSIEFTGPAGSSEALRETLLSLGNGYLGMRGTGEEGGGPESIPGTYINGFHETAPIVYGERFPGFADEKQTMINIADARLIRITADGVDLGPDAPGLTDERRTLDLRRGRLNRSLTWNLPTGGTLEIETTRMIHQVREHLALSEYRIRSRGFDGPLTVNSGIDTGSRQNRHDGEDPRLGTAFSGDVLATSEPQVLTDGLILTQSTMASGMRLCCGYRELWSVDVESTEWRGDGVAGRRYTLPIRDGETVILRKYMAYFDGSTADPRRVEGELEAALDTGLPALIEEQESFMASFWNDADIRIEGDPRMQQGIRFNLFHVLQSAGRDGRRNAAAKGLSGPGYEGHYFWDTETYILPVFIHTRPRIAAALLEYRYHGLDAARDHARKMGHPVGALYPWRTIDGRECSANFITGSAQYHINADIAFAVRRYVDATGDEEFMGRFGAEILCETARLWCDAGHFDAVDGRFRIESVTGPDEYHVLVNNNAYTNLMARENLRGAADAVDRLRENDPGAFATLVDRIDLSADEVVVWRKAADRMYVPYDPERRLIPQDDGFLHKEPWDFQGTPAERYPLLLHYHPLTVNRYQVCKQADLLLAHLLLPDAYDIDQKRRDFDYYESVTTHDSSLSACVFGILASELGEAEKADRYFRETALADLDDIHGNTAVGIHAATMAGTWQSIVFGFAGMRSGPILRFEPKLPKAWESCAFSVRYRGRKIAVRITREETELRLESGDPMDVAVGGRTLRLESD